MENGNVNWYWHGGWERELMVSYCSKVKGHTLQLADGEWLLLHGAKLVYKEPFLISLSLRWCAVVLYLGSPFQIMLSILPIMLFCHAQNIYLLRSSLNLLCSHILRTMTREKLMLIMLHHERTFNIVLLLWIWKRSLQYWKNMFSWCWWRLYSKNRSTHTWPRR